MSLTGVEDAEEETGNLFAEKVPKDVIDYVTAASEKQNKSKKHVIVTALRLDRDLAEKLQAEVTDIQAFAKKSRLKMSTDLAEILARLVKRALRARDNSE